MLFYSVSKVQMAEIRSFFLLSQVRFLGMLALPDRYCDAVGRLGPRARSSLWHSPAQNLQQGTWIRTALGSIPIIPLPTTHTNDSTREIGYDIYCAQSNIT